MMEQTKIGSFVESCFNTGIGMIFSIAAQLLIFPVFGVHVSLHQNVGIAVCFTVVSVVRGYIVRRWFNDRLHRAAMSVTKRV